MHSSQYVTHTGMKRAAALIAFSLAICIPTVAHASETDYVRGDFSINGYINVATGWQHFSNDPVTEVAQDGSFPGPLGELIPDVQNGTTPRPGQDNFEFAVQVIELDMIKRFGDRAKVRADIQFGRAASGSSVGCFNPGGGAPIACLSIEHAYADVTLSEEHNLKFTLGRFGLQAGFEPYEGYYNDTISWSILWRGLIELGVTTGAQLSMDINDHVSLYLAATNGFIRDVIPNFAHIPSLISSAVFTWGPADRQNNFVISAFGGSEANNNYDFYLGYDAYITWWFANDWELGLESTFQHHEGSDTGPSTTYVASLLNLHWDITTTLYGVLKYAHAWQSSAGNQFINLTGAHQHVHEISVGGAYYVADSAKIKFEWRTDIIDPAVGSTQAVYGAAAGFAYAF